MLVLSDCAVHIHQHLIAFYTTCCLSCLMVIMLGHLDRQFTDQTKHRGHSRVMCRHRKPRPHLQYHKRMVTEAAVDVTTATTPLVFCHHIDCRFCRRTGWLRDL